MNNHDQFNNFVRRGRDAQRSVDRILSANAPTVPSQQSPRDDGASRDLKPKRRKLSNDVDVHWRTDQDGYEHIMRTVHEMKGVKNLAEAERKRWFTRGWRDRLEKQRARQRKAGEPDEKFLPKRSR